MLYVIGYFVQCTLLEIERKGIMFAFRMFSDLHFYLSFIEILTSTKQQWLKIDKNSKACWTSSSVLLYHWFLEMLIVSDRQKHTLIINY